MLLTTDRSSHSQMFFKIGVLNSFAKFTRKHLSWSLFLIKLQAFRPSTFLKETPTQVLFCELFKFFKEQLFEQSTSGDCFWTEAGRLNILMTPAEAY